MSLGGTVVNLGANTDKFKKGIGSAQSGLKSFASSAKAFLNPITVGLAAMTAGAVAAGGAVYLITNRIGGLAKIADQAVQTGLSGEFLQRLGYAADQSGVSIETLTGGVKKLTIAIGKGDEKPFAELGLSLKELKTLSPDQQFMKVAEAIGKLPTAADRAAASVKIFGKAGIEMTGLFAGGLNDVNRLMEEATALNIGLSEEELGRISAADDAIQKMKAAFGALLDKVTVGLAPTFQGIADYITAWIPPITEAIGKFNEMEGKFTWLKDTGIAAFDVLIETVKANFFTMLDDVGQKIKDVAVNPLHGIGSQLGEDFAFAVGLSDERLDLSTMKSGGNGLGDAQKRLDAQMEKLNAPSTKPAWQGPKIPEGGLPPTPEMQGKQMGDWMKSMLPGAKKIGDAIAGTVSGVGGALAGIGTGPAADAVAAKQTAPQFAGAMQKGSAEAYSTILAAMRGSKDPIVKATEKQTKDLIKGLKPHPPSFFLKNDFGV